VNAINPPPAFSETPPRPPFRDSFSSGVVEDISNFGVISFTSTFSFNEEDLSSELGSFAIGAYFFTYDRSVSVRLGYEYIDPESLDPFEVIRSTNIQGVEANRSWAFVSETFSLPESFESLKFIIEVSYTKTDIPYKFAINGINIGQWAEEFHLESMGVSPEPIPDNIPIISDGVPALQYGFDGFRGYYLSEGSVLYAKNSGMPLVYGAFNSTVILPNQNKPSLILPGFGFLNESGKYKDFTLEFWAKIQSNATQPRRFAGPIDSTDGLYVDGPFLKIKVGDHLGSHYVGEWDRPMLIAIRFATNRASLVLNGEQVVSLKIKEEDLFFPEKEDENGKDLDWLGFYAYEDVPSIQLDAVGIYPYEVPTIVLKRRWVYGQAVELPDNIKGMRPENSVFIDYPFANYIKNYSYPSMGRWRNGVIENLTPEATQLSLPEYSLPKISFNNQSVDQWYLDNRLDQSGQDAFFRLKPNAEWEDTEGHLLFEQFNLLTTDTKCFYAIVEIEAINEEEQVIFEIVNEVLGSSLQISLVGTIINYKLFQKNAAGNTTERIVYFSDSHIVDNKFLVGLNIPRFSLFYGQAIRSFFGSKQNLKMFFGGAFNFSKTFQGKVYRLGFSTERNLRKIESLFSERGIPKDFENVFDQYSLVPNYDAGGEYFGNDPETWSLVLDGGGPLDFSDNNIEKKNTHMASYTLLPKISFENYVLDIGVDSYWEDYLPLSYFGGNVDGADGKKFFSLDFLQLNIDYPKFSKILNNGFDTSGSMVKTYVSFQYLQNGSNSSSENFTKIQSLPRGGVVTPGSDWINTKYEVLDDTVIYPPAGVNFKSLSINIHIEMSVNGIIENPVKIRSLKLASQAFGYSPTKIGTRSGATVVPFQKFAAYIDYRNVPAFGIYRGSTPHLYMTGSSGLRLRGDFAASVSKGLSIEINKNASSFFKLGSMQMALRYDEVAFPLTPVQIFEIQKSEDIIRFYLIANNKNGKRGQIFAISNNTGKLYPGILYYLDGKAVNKAIVNSKSWLMLGIAFETALDFGGKAGALNFTNPIMFDNISYYQTTEEDEAQRFAFRKWFAVRSEPDNPLTWDYWNESTWQQVLFLTESDPKILDPASIYKKYTGTDRVTMSGDSTLIFNDYKYTAYTNIGWSRQILDSA
jgi:hypothetical protein